MIVNKQVVTMDPIEVTFTGITLLSKEEYEANRDIIPEILGWWWLRTPGEIECSAACVNGIGSLYDDFVSCDDACVRPALYIWNPQSSNLHRGDKFELAGLMWTVLSGDLALCDSSIDWHCFRKDWKADGANDFEKSDIRRFLNDWADNLDIRFMMQAFSPD